MISLFVYLVCLISVLSEKHRFVNNRGLETIKFEEIAFLLLLESIIVNPFPTGSLISFEFE